MFQLHYVLLSGGSGQRLWPLSNDSRSKQFLKLLQGADHQYESMVQRVFSQLQSFNMQDSTVIATSKAQVEILQNQLGEQIPLIVEPERRNTFPAIALAASYLFSKKKAGLKEYVVILPVDPYVDATFFECVQQLGDLLSLSNAEIALMGVTPTHASEKYGYFIPASKDTNNPYFTVERFKEKPSEFEALQLIKQKALWNCGVFAFQLDYVLSILSDRGFPTEFDQLYKRYHELPKNSFDYEVVEHATNIVALPYDGDWKDLGTWNTLTDEMAGNLMGNGIISDDSENTHLINELDIPITVLGVSNAVVAASPDGILVTDKETSPRIKSVMKGFKQRPMYEERKWGWYRVLDYKKYENDREVLTKRVCLLKGKHLSYQFHRNRSENWTIIRGQGEFILNGEFRNVEEGEVLTLKPEDCHAIKAVTDMEFIEIQFGNEVTEEDVVRIYSNWDEILKNFSS